MARHAELTRRLAALAALLVGAIIIAVVALHGVTPPRVNSLEGVVPATVQLADMPLGTGHVRIPGKLSAEGVPADGLVTLRWDVNIPEGAPEIWGVWFERPQYASELRWDGRLVGATGEVHGDARSERGLLAPVMTNAPGVHQLELTVRGDYGKGGLLGRAVHGPFDDVVRLARVVESERVGLVMLLCALGVLQLTLAARRPQRPASLFLGLLCLAIALYVSLRTDLSTLILPDALPGIRLRRFATAWLGPLGLGLAATFDRQDTPPWMAYILGAGGVLSLGAFVLPAAGLPFLEITLDALLLASALTFIIVLVPVVWRSQPGAMALVLATAGPLGYGVISEVLVTHGFISAGGHMLPTVGGFTLGATVALVVRDADLSERHNRLVRWSSDAMLGIDRNGVVQDANPAAEQMFSRNPTGTRLVDWIASEDQPLMRAHITFEEHRPPQIEVRLRGQERIVECVATEIDSKKLLVAIRDVTRRTAMNRGQVQAARMETLAVLVGGIAHDFNNILGTLLAHIGFLQVTTARDGSVQQRLGRMEATIDRASVLTRRLATLTGSTGSTLGPTDLSRVIRETLDLVRPSFDERLTIEEDLPAVLPQVAASVTDLQHILVNLLVNARDAVGRTGHVAVRARPFTTDEGATGVLILVEDDGPGVPLDLRETIFTPFFTTKDARAGNGLGLAVAVQLVREHHGRLWVEDRPGGGARFCLALHDATVLDLEDAPLTEEPDGEQVFLVEDEPVLRDTFASALERAGFTVTALPDGAAAIEALAETRPDVFVTDVLMPGISGVDLARFARGRYPEVPILLVSGYIPDDAMLGDDPLMHRLDKPVRTARLVAVVKRLCRLAARRADGEVEEHVFPSLDGASWERVSWGPSDAPRGRRVIPFPPHRSTPTKDPGQPTGE